MYIFVRTALNTFVFIDMSARSLYFPIEKASISFFFILKKIKNKGLLLWGFGIFETKLEVNLCIIII